jgi:hypothetical protein
MIDLDELTKELEKMTKRSLIYGIVRKEIIKRGNWKNSKRGKAFKTGHDERRGEIKKS